MTAHYDNAGVQTIHPQPFNRERREMDGIDLELKKIQLLREQIALHDQLGKLARKAAVKQVVSGLVSEIDKKVAKVRAHRQQRAAEMEHERQQKVAEMERDRAAAAAALEREWIQRVTTQDAKPLDTSSLLAWIIIAVIGAIAVFYCFSMVSNAA